MRLVNIIFSDKQRLQVDFKQHQIQSGGREKYFIQVFGPLSREISEYLIDVLNELLPDCEILLASSAYQVYELKTMSQIVLGISCFEYSDIKTAHFPSGLDELAMAQRIFDTLITPRTKLLIIFIEHFSVSGEILLAELFRLCPELIVCGGRAAGNQMKAIRTLVGDKHGVYIDGIVCGVIDSDVLRVQNSYVFGWRPIGLSLEVTRSEKNTIYEIEHTPIKEIYRHYLGEEVSSNLEKVGWNFPFILEDEKGNFIGRVLNEVRSDGGISFLGNIPNGARVKFSFGFLENVEKDSLREKIDTPQNVQAVYMYSCIGRVLFLGLEGINRILEVFMDTQAACGFFTYGEVYHFSNANTMLNLANTRIVLSEDDFKDTELKKENPQIQWNQESMILNAITHLSQVTSKELDEASLSLKSYRDLVIEAVQHIEVDRDLRITFTNEKMSRISGYSPQEQIGKSVLEFLDDEMIAYATDVVIPTLQAKGTWSGKMHHIRKDGSPYYVNIFIKAVFDHNNQVSSYIIGEIDRTEEEMRQRKLENDLVNLKYSEEEKRYLLQQYEDIIDETQSHFRLDLNRNFIYANKTFLDISGFKLEEILGKNIYEFLSPSQRDQFQEIGKALNTTGIYRGIIEHNRTDGTHFYVHSIGVYIRNLQGEPVEIMAVGVDITKIMEFQAEIESVQRDIIIAMGTICEGKSRETGNHIKRVAAYSELLAKLYGCSPADQELIFIASPMHDIGKIGIPDAILNKPGKLTAEEFEIMKTHTTLGEEMLGGSHHLILKTASQIAGSHHEHWAGGGYPRGLIGEDIPLFGRIVALVDVFDAISNDRVYKKAWPLPDVIAYIKELKGKQFQPELVDLFLANIDEFLAISAMYKD
ncbi:hypothetical protein BKH46_06855 [Helicobacter sp. 12S02634-8]|uniref:HD domain-containing phosphohydrolase n=1 Tax=Helicobacter sp. 12S02634-8 TaxID=1476199 RepID=UPI000BA542D6|nr:HD domain-containing phosphohydrolase [Helicobacter sp. 12S02634-8]PAF46682.1 hypothetical protein BKH46_06855 [Helicobacter sp. 12S02634-8]